jgi:uncharacterized RDD family membrane protein YckC
MFCPACGAPALQEATFCIRCGARLDMAAEAAPEAAAAPPAATPGPRIHAGFWRRYVGGMADAAIIGVVTFLVASAGVAIAQSVHNYEIIIVACALLMAVITWLYFAGLESRPGWGTLGKRLAGITVVDRRGQPLGFGRATGRFWARALSALPLLAGFLLPAFTRRRQAPHDMVCGALVVSRRASLVEITAETARTMPLSPLAGGLALLVTAPVVFLAVLIGQDIARSRQVATPVPVEVEMMITEQAVKLSELHGAPPSDDVEIIPSGFSMGGASELAPRPASR